MESFDFVCCYLSPNIGMEEYKREVDNIMNGVYRRQTIILGDINAKSSQWGAPQTDNKGEYWQEWIHTRDMVVLNDGKEPTFVRGATESHIDVTLSTYRIAKQIVNWRVMDEDSLTDHKYIYFELKAESRRNMIERTNIRTTVDWENFRHNVKKVAQEAGAMDHDRCTKMLQTVYKDSTRKQYGRATIPYWWNDSIATRRRECTKLRRKLTRETRAQRANNNNGQILEETREAYKICKRELVKSIKEAM
ncbi:Endonuclease-reverse transcriptase [Popillia japonica]|uniref:Endonuclease-reverse transcriptase n=1 Tax=Popillia japonica TaxID=7064 RepID=A0AAW1KQU2_POPJA